MRIVQVVQGLSPESLGGTETYVAHLSRALALRGHEVSVFSRIADPSRAEYAVDVSVRDLVTITRFNNTLSSLQHFARSYRDEEIAQRFGAFLDARVPG